MMLTNKRGVSGVVTAILLILLVIAAIGILWVVFQNFVKEGTRGLEGSTDCLTTTFVIDSGATVGSDAIVVKRTGGSASVDSFRVIVDGDLKSSPSPVGAFGIGETESLTVLPLTDGQTVEVSVVFGQNTCSLGASATV